ncbi:hypothetical protein KIN20_003627 [Parelaphostrongylus tenuis]|uniref:Uncharacterized protein n=1 Tax=Parelaphostrongylus tenuis TaxID=148309 RepID=A0AAD5QEJ6_PARTN|nr:hypothetical protein KIN20_003627 [Parelaphostrongylus tenuis]
MSSENVPVSPYSMAVVPHFATLSRSATSSRANPSAKAFGEKTTMSKEDHDRERTRWLLRLEEIETRLADSETLNSDMHQIRAELKKKIVELEKSQKPLIEQNRKINDRNKLLQQEVKKLEQKLCHCQDDFLTLKDAHERLVKEHAQLKEKRAYPEKMEELERYRVQVLEYSKCITALRSSGLEKDRRYELLVQKLKRLRKCLKKGETDDDRQSIVGSDCSTESYISLDAIAEDFESFNTDIDINYQTLYRENSELQKALQAVKLNPAAVEDSLLRDQLTCAQTTIAQQQILLNKNDEMIRHLKNVAASQADRIRQLEQQIEDMDRELCASREAHELLEFQVLEKEENSKCSTPPEQNHKCFGTEEFTIERHDKSCETDDLGESSSPRAHEKRALSPTEVVSLKKSMSELRNAINLRLAQCHVIGQAEDYIGDLEDQLFSTNLVHREETHQLEERVKELQNQIEESYSKQRRKKELQVEVEELRKKLTEIDTAKNNLSEELRTTSKELTKVKCQLQSNDVELEREKKLAESLNKQLQNLVESHHLEKDSFSRVEEELNKTKELYNSSKTAVEQLEKERNELSKKFEQLSSEYEKLKEDQRPSIRTELERRYEEIRYRLNTALEKIHEYEIVIESAKKAEDSTLSEVLQRDLIQLKEYNEHLERQFKTQTEIIETLKDKLIKQKTFADLIQKLSIQGDIQVVENELNKYLKSVDRDTGRLAENFIFLLGCASKIRMGSPIVPLEINTTHQNIRPYSSVDSSMKGLSNSSEDISPDSDGPEWNERRISLKEVQCGADFGQRLGLTNSS